MTFKAAKAKAISKSDLFGSVVDLAKYTEDEFAQVASAFQGDDPFTINYKVPTRPRTGTLVYADGTHWNPGAGEGFYQYTSAGIWEPLSALEIGGVFAKAFTLNATSGISNTGSDIELLQASASQFGAAKVDNSTIAAVAGVLSTLRAAKADQVTGTDIHLAVTPSVQQNHPSAVKAWVKFVGSGVNGAQTIKASYNVSSVTRTSAGQYTVAFTTAFSTADYCVSGTHNANTAINGFMQVTSTALTLAGSCSVSFINISGPAAFDPTNGAFVQFSGIQ